MTDDDQDGYQQGFGIISRDYHRDVRFYAMEALRLISTGDIVGHDELTDWVRETADGSEWTIYTGRALAVALVSRNDEAWEDLFLERPSAEVVAYFAVKADIDETIPRLVADAGLPDDFDLHDDATWPANRDESEED